MKSLLLFVLVLFSFNQQVLASPEIDKLKAEVISEFGLESVDVSSLECDLLPKSSETITIFALEHMLDSGLTMNDLKVRGINRLQITIEARAMEPGQLSYPWTLEAKQIRKLVLKQIKPIDG